MKKVIFILSMIVGLSAVAQVDVEWTMEQELPVKLSMITVSDNAQVKIIQANRNSVKVKSDTSDVVTDLIKNVVKLRETTLLIGDDHKVEVSVSDLNSLYIVTSDNAKVSLSSELKSDSISIDSLSFLATCNSMITVKTPIKNAKVGIQCLDNASIQLNEGVFTKNLKYKNSDNATIYIKDLIQSNTSCEGYKVDDLHNCPLQDIPGYYSVANRLNAGFYFGWNNWGDAPMNGFVSIPGAYNASTTLSALTFEVSYSLICRRHFAAGIGVGIGRNKMKFTNPYVAYGENGLVTTAPEQFQHDLQGWESSYFIRQVSLPIHFNYYVSPKHWKGFSTSITVIPMLHFATKKAGLNNEYSSSSSDGHNLNLHEYNSNNPLKAFNCDIRVALAYSWLNVYLQTSLLPVFDKSKMDDTNIYPVSIGLGISF